MHPDDEAAHQEALKRFGGKMPEGDISARGNKGIITRPPSFMVEQLLRGRHNCDPRGKRRSAKQS